MAPIMRGFFIEVIKMFLETDYENILDRLKNKKVINVGGNGEVLEIEVEDGTLIQISAFYEQLQVEVF